MGGTPTQEKKTPNGEEMKDRIQPAPNVLQGMLKGKEDSNNAAASQSQAKEHRVTKEQYGAYLFSYLLITGISTPSYPRTQRGVRAVHNTTSYKA